MKRTMTMLMAAAILAMTAGAAFAGNETPGVDRRQDRQHDRISQGRKSGDLTDAEARRLRKGQRRVQRMEDRAKADGVVTAAERARLQKSLDRQSKAIHRKRHNARTK